MDRIDLHALPGVAKYLCARLAWDGFDYDVDARLDPASATVLVTLFGERRRWLDEEPRVLARLRRLYEPAWRTPGFAVSYRVADRAAA